MEDEHDQRLRQAAVEHVRRLAEQYPDGVPRNVLLGKFEFEGRRVSLNTFQSGIFRPKEMHGPAALSLFTTPEARGKPAPYEDSVDPATGEFTYRFRDARQDTLAALAAAERDNRGLIAAHERGLPLIYFRGVAPAFYVPLAPAFVTRLDVPNRTAWLQVGLTARDGLGEGIPTHDARRYATREAVYRLHQQRFRAAVLRAYRTRCAVCTLKEAPLLQAAHITADGDENGHATVVNGVSLCAIHHLAYDRNIMGIDPKGTVHIHQRLLDEIDGPMLKHGLQHFHGADIELPRAKSERPDPERLEVRFTAFREAA